jgi:staphylococcal nuclease domain-containing protein 1
MGVRDIKIGYSTKQALVVERHNDFGFSGTFANIIEPFPASKQPSETEFFPPPRIKDRRSKRYPNSKPNVPPARYNTNMPASQAKVKSVMSGDTVVLASVTTGKERQMSLAYCTSPHMKKDGDEQWAYESRDALRELLVGKLVHFNILYQIPNTKREYGIVFLQDGRRIPEEMLKAGWLKLREDAGRKEDSPEAVQQLDHLRLLEATAKSEEKGLWQPGGARIDVQHDMGDPKAFIEEWKGKTVDGLVERVLSGDRMVVRYILSPTKHCQGMSSSDALNM